MRAASATSRWRPKDLTARRKTPACQAMIGKAMHQVLPFILCGGSGTRLWPLSREAYPKQFHRLTGSESLLQLTCRRLSGPLFGELSILSNHRYRFLIAEQLEEIG